MLVRPVRCEVCILKIKWWEDNMKIIVISMLAILSSCGDYKTGQFVDSTVGEVKSISAPIIISGVEKDNLVSVCNSLSQKELVLESAVNTRHIFSANQTDCQGKSVSSGDVPVTIQKSGSSYVFKKGDGLDFLFPNVETTSSGLFSEICSNLDGLSNPIIGQNEVIFISSLGINPGDCAQAYGEICIKLEKAYVQGATAVVHTKEWIRLRTPSVQGFVGFFTMRKKVSKSFCPEGQTITSSASLK